MIRSCSGLVLAAVFQLTFGLAEESDFASGRLPSPDPQQQGIYSFQDRIPRHCWSPPPGINIYKCCPIPKFFSDEVMEQCGIEKAPRGGPNEPPRSIDISKVPCRGMCLMENANLLRANQSVDYEKLSTFIDHWAETNPDFTEAILAAKKICVKDGVPSGPPVCEQDRIFICLNSNIIWNCKFKELDGGCGILKAHMDECRPHYLKEQEE